MADSSTALVSWNAVTTNADATPCTDLHGYLIYFSQVPGTWPFFIDVGNTLSTLMTGSQFTNDGKWYFSVVARDTTGNESTKAPTTPASKRIIRTRSKIRRTH